MHASTARAESVVALVGEDILATFDSRTAKTTSLVKIDGVGPILGIDVRPADGQLYALANDGTIAIVDPASGKATAKSKLDKLPQADVPVAVDFNPVADKMRIIAADGSNLRADVDNGKVTEDQSLKFAATDAAAGRKPTIVAAGYSNSLKGAKETTLYDIDALGGLFRQAPPNDGVLNTIGMIGLSIDKIGFDIVTDGAGISTGVLVVNGKLYTLDLTTGKAAGGTTIVGLPSDVRDIAVLLPATAKQAANMMGGAEMASSFVAKPMPGNVADPLSKPMPMKAKMEAPRTSPYRADSGMRKDGYSATKMMRMRGPQCSER
jgi:hypothetical protein